jgi:hypothetical protein
MKSLSVATAIRRVEAYRLIDVLIIAGLTALVVIQVANFASGVA